MVLLPGVLRRPTASALTQIFWLLDKKTSALYFIGEVGEPKWFRLLPCDANGKKIAGGQALNVPSMWLDPDLCLPAELSSGERQTKLLAYLLRQRNVENESHALSVSPRVSVPWL